MLELDLVLKAVVMRNEHKKIACCFIPILGCCFIGCCLDGSRPCLPTSQIESNCNAASKLLAKWNTAELEWSIDFQPMSDRFPGADRRTGMPAVVMKTPGAEANMAQQVIGQAVEALPHQLAAMFGARG